MLSMSFFGNPGTMRSTSVAYTAHEFSNHCLKPSPSFQSSMYWYIVSFSLWPLRNMSSQGKIMSPLEGSPPKNLNLWYSSCVSLPGYELAGSSSSLHEGSKAMPASVVLDITKRIPGCSASERKALKSL